MLYFENGNIVTGNYPIFCQQVNCKGMMNAGLAKQIRNKYPEVYKEYKHLCMNGNAKIGTIQPILTSDGRYCINMFAQYSYGRDRCYTNYEAFKQCLEKLMLNLVTYKSDTVVAFPAGIGCGLAGGNWKEILNLLKWFSEMIFQDVVIVHKETV